MADALFEGVQQMRESSVFQGIERGALARGRVEGIAVGVQNSILAALRKRFGAVPPEVESRVKAVTDIARLEAALLQTFDVAAVDELVV